MSSLPCSRFKLVFLKVALLALSFLVYVNDLPTCLNHCQVALYADNRVIYFSSSSVAEIEHFLNEDLSKLSLWFKRNRLTLNISKSKFILIGSPQKISSCNNINIVIDKLSLKSTATFKNFGLTINKTVTWGDHFETISTKINQRLGLLERIKHLLRLEMHITLYISLVCPRFDYADTIWGDFVRVIEPLWVSYNSHKMRQPRQFLICQVFLHLEKH